LLITIDASKTPELVFEDIKKVLDGVKWFLLKQIMKLSLCE
jgi:hypothetical protein